MTYELVLQCWLEPERSRQPPSCPHHRQLLPRAILRTVARHITAMASPAVCWSVSTSLNSKRIPGVDAVPWYRLQACTWAFECERSKRCCEWLDCPWATMFSLAPARAPLFARQLLYYVRVARTTTARRWQSLARESASRVSCPPIPLRAQGHPLARSVESKVESRESLCCPKLPPHQ